MNTDETHAKRPSFFSKTDINTLVPKLPLQWNLTELLETVGDAMSFVPDYTVTLQSTVQCLEITGEHYLVARYLTDCMMRGEWGNFSAKHSLFITSHICLEAVWRLNLRIVAHNSTCPT